MGNVPSTVLGEINQILELILNRDTGERAQDYEIGDGLGALALP